MKRKAHTKNAPRLLLVLIGGLLVCILAYFVEARLMSQQDANAPSEPAARLMLNELMSRNDTALIDDTGAYPDWIEIINADDSPVDLEGWSLATLDAPLDGFIFPSVTLQSGQCLLVYASGRDGKDSLHARFRLSASGETVVLSDPFGVTADRVELPALSADQVWMRDASGGEWTLSTTATPGWPNRPEYAVGRAVAQDVISISEVIPSNASLTASGADLIELHNASTQAVSLAGYSLTDHPEQPRKYVLGDVTIEPDGYVLIEADGITTPFRLKAQGEELLLYRPSGELVSCVSWTDMQPDQSISDWDGQWTRSVPTPGYANTPEGAAQFDHRLTAGNSTGRQSVRVSQSAQDRRKLA